MGVVEMAEITKEELLQRLRTTRSWKESGLTPKDVCKAIESDFTAGMPSDEHLYCQNNEIDSEAIKMRERELLERITELEKKISRLTTTNKQLRAENKALKVENRE